MVGLSKRVLATASAIVTITLTVIYAIANVPSPGVSDFLAYWSASRQLLACRNPYSISEVLSIEHQVGLSGDEPLVMRNPPWAGPVVLPFGFLPYVVAQRLWFYISLLSIAFAVYLWILYTGPPNSWYPMLFALVIFLPIPVVCLKGQIGPLMLLGLMAFLVSEKQHNDVLAGLCLLLPALKPHLLFLLWPILFLWTARARRWKVLVGFSAALVIALLITFVFDRHIFGQYVVLWREAGLASELQPTLSDSIRLLFKTVPPWVRYLPACAACIWALAHWFRRRERWSWFTQLPLLLLVSLTFSPYVWYFDQVLLIPAVCDITARLDTLPPLRKRIVAMGYVLTNFLVLTQLLMHKTGFWYVWTCPVLLAVYILAQAGEVKSTKEHPPIEAASVVKQSCS